MVAQLSNDEIKSLMKKKTYANINDLQNSQFISRLESFGREYLDHLKRELEKYIGNTSLTVEFVNVRVGNPELYNSLDYKDYVHLDARDRFNVERKTHIFTPKYIFEVMHRAKNTSSNIDYNKVATKFLNLINNSFQIYTNIDLPLFELNEFKEINETQTHLANELYQELLFEISIDGQKLQIVQLLTINLVQEIYDKNTTKEKKSSSMGDAMQNEFGTPFEESGIEFLYNVPLELSVVLGGTRMTVKEVLGFSMGQVIELDRLVDAPLDIFVNNQLVAKGEVVVVDENFGIKITELKSVEKDKLF